MTSRKFAYNDVEIAFLVVRWYHDGNHVVTPEQATLAPTCNVRTSRVQRAVERLQVSFNSTPDAPRESQGIRRAAREGTLVLPRAP